jgi:uncharacterized membrane protein YidH (DUF202 family)
VNDSAIIGGFFVVLGAAIAFGALVRWRWLMCNRCVDGLDPRVVSAAYALFGAVLIIAGIAVFAGG